MSSSIRELTRRQFADGCTVDGDRIDVALRDLVLNVNNVGPKWLKRRFVHTQFVRHLMPVPYSAPTLEQDNPPFLLTRNLDTQAVGGTYEAGFQNEWRLKGEAIPGIPFANYDNQTEGIYAWTNSLYFRKPVIITGISFRAFQPILHDYDNDWTYHTDAPEGKSNGETVDDLFFEISVDNPFNMEARNLNDIELHKIRFQVDSQRMANTLAYPPDNNLTVATLNHEDPAIWVHEDNLCIPLHRDTRARISVAIPQYDDNAGGDDVSGWQSDGANSWDPWQSAIWSMTLTVLEPLVEE